MRLNFTKLLSVYGFLVFLFGCNESQQNATTPPQEITQKAKEVVVFSINDPHGRLGNFPKIKPVLEEARKNYDAVFFISAGDLFSGNPIVDFYEEKGYPMIDLLNDLEMDVSVIGNHEFDYGQQTLADRISQANFPFICLNVQGGPAALESVEGATVLEKNGIRLAFVGVVETSSPMGHPLTHPKKIQNLEFEDGIEAFGRYSQYKAENKADVLIALTHQGEEKDAELLAAHSNIDLVIGGHTNQIYGKQKANGYMVMAGKHLETLGKTTFRIVEGEVQDFSFAAIDLDAELTEDTFLAQKVEAFSDAPEFYEVIGNSAHAHDRTETACFYVKALREETQADLFIQNTGGVRDDLLEGNITPFVIYSIDPFGNGLDKYQMTVAQLQTFLSAYRSSYSYDSYYELRPQGDSYQLIGEDGTALAQDQLVNFAVNDYISNQYPELFESIPSLTYSMTTADYLIQYVRAQTTPLDFSDCNQKQ